MTLDDLLADLTARGVLLTVDGDKLKVDAPAGALTPVLRAALSERKAELLAYLNRASAPAAPEVIRVPLSLECSPSEWLAARGLSIVGGTPAGPRGPLLYLAELAEGDRAPQP